MPPPTDPADAPPPDARERLETLTGALRDMARNGTGSTREAARHLLSLAGLPVPDDPERRGGPGARAAAPRGGGGGQRDPARGGAAGQGQNGAGGAPGAAPHR